eukprot:102526_1
MLEDVRLERRKHIGLILPSVYTLTNVWFGKLDEFPSTTFIEKLKETLEYSRWNLQTTHANRRSLPFSKSVANEMVFFKGSKGVIMSKPIKQQRRKPIKEQ